MKYVSPVNVLFGLNKFRAEHACPASIAMSMLKAASSGEITKFVLN